MERRARTHGCGSGDARPIGSIQPMCGPGGRLDGLSHGHSKLQGNRTVGITEKPDADMLAGIVLPDPDRCHRDMRNPDFAVHLNTRLSRSHMDDLRAGRPISRRLRPSRHAVHERGRFGAAGARAMRRDDPASRPSPTTSRRARSSPIVPGRITHARSTIRTRLAGRLATGRCPCGCGRRLDAGSDGGRTENRTRIRGFAVLCIATLPSGRMSARYSHQTRDRSSRRLPAAALERTEMCVAAAAQLSHRLCPLSHHLLQRESMTSNSCISAATAPAIALSPADAADINRQDHGSARSGSAALRPPRRHRGLEIRSVT